MITMKNELFERMIGSALSCGASAANIISTADIVTDRRFRDMCAVNSCGKYGRCWMCPPDVGEIDELMAEVKKYTYALVYQYVGVLEDSFDFEGMVAAKKRHYKLSFAVRDSVLRESGIRCLHLGAGGCGVCKKCTKESGEPCRHPDLAMPSLEAYGINVSMLASAAGMKYINGADTVTYFGAVLFDLISE